MERSANLVRFTNKISLPFLGLSNLIICSESLPAEIMNVYYQNGTCDPYEPTEKPCTLGNLASYSISVTGVDDVVAGINFANQNNVRLVIKNTGHE